MRRFFIEAALGENERCVVTGSEARHIAKVLRMGRGDRLILIDKTGERFQAVIESADPGRVAVVLERTLPRPPSSPVEIVLCRALLKSRPMDYLIQKTSELGVHRICPFYSVRSAVHLKRDRMTSRMRHWREIAVNAAKQSDRAVPVEIERPVAFDDLINAWRDQDACRILLWEAEGSTHLKTLIRARGGRTERFVAVVGPEGGFDPHEVETAAGAGFVSASLGRRILRAETAAMIVAALIQYEWGDLGP